ncbi:adenosine deaminase [Massilia sp. Dwa41.01b]|uniref:adenosine deaminase n=1 Tax=unclassified Massilia TaxID=2609279 RepID=UPI0016015908|nr:MULTISPECIES: adenosine deaminase [unclassified Massilia]QNA88085.1 adenosine deaminase [Massilia sp. Dwa41.01b]QNA98994.1 adenosine deaminase [Massilia sp. Se16.2.3]
MQIKPGTSLLIALAMSAAPALAKEPSTATRQANEAATARHYASLIAGSEPKLSELTLFFTQMPKGGDLHHHYSGSIYVEQYLDFLDKQGLCVNKGTYRIETDKAAIALERAKPARERNCLSSAEVYADDHTWRELAQRWSTKDFANHGALNPPPDRAFFQTFGYFGPVSNANFKEGLQELKKRAIAENVSYIETMFKMSPTVSNPEFDTRAWQLANDDAALDAELRRAHEALERDPVFAKNIADFVAKINEAAEGIDDERFTMRYQTYVLRLLGPSQVFSSMVSAFKSASSGGKVVGVNIVGQESTMVSMRDYALHMKMFRFLKSVYPDVKVAMHAGELALGDVPPEGLKFHIDQALVVAKADRIGHGIDLAHEANAVGIMRKMRQDDVPVEINLTSNAFISGIEGANHPITLYRKYGVPYVISTDDAGVTRHTLSQEYVLFASRYKPDYAELKKASYNSVRYAFLPAPEKARLTRQLDARFASFEAEIAGLAKNAVRMEAPKTTQNRHK